MKKTTKIVSLLCVIALIFACFAGCAKKTDSKLEYTINEETNEITITGYTDSTDRKELVIPDEIDGVPVTKIADFGVFNAESLVKITIGKNVKEIGTWAMTNNQRLQEFVVDPANESFTAVDGILFTKDMKELVYYPNARGVVEYTKYGDPMHRDKPWGEPNKDDYKDKKGKFQEDKYNDAVKDYEKKIKDFIEVTYDIPEGVEIIRSKAFYKCWYLDKVTFPESVKRIEEKAFHHCGALDEINLPSQLEFIGKDAFAYCDRVKSVVIPASIKQIDEYAFFFCTSMNTVDIEADENAVKLGKNWYPTNNGRQIKDCKINWKNAAEK